MSFTPLTKYNVFNLSKKFTARQKIDSYAFKLSQTCLKSTLFLHYLFRMLKNQKKIFYQDFQSFKKTDLNKKAYICLEKLD